MLSKRILIFLAACLLAAGSLLRAQSAPSPRPDTFCISLDTINTSNLFIGSVTANDGFMPTAGVSIVSDLETPCLVLNELGRLWFPTLPTADCCGEYRIRYRYQGVECPNGPCESTVFVKIICPKPNCDLVDIDPLLQLTDPTGEQGMQTCIQACERSSSTYYTAFSPLYTYTWLAENGVPTIDPSSPAQVTVDWGAVGSPTSLSLIKTATDGRMDTFRLCVELSLSPVADFVFTPAGCVNSPVCFTNTSTGAATYFWDFGDGNFSTDPAPCHEYAAGGTYTVTLSATSAGGTNPDGSLACCCTDVITMEIEIDPRPGPNIYWISTLCEGDTSLYWTDADCSTYNWAVLDANGIAVPFSTNATGDTISVVWGAGPIGTISLATAGCVVDYCPQGSTVVVPIISVNGQIIGDQTVCQGDTYTYSLPKWMGVAYNWSVSGGSLLGSANGHQIQVQWGGVGPASIQVTYGSDFLAGLPSHSGDDCIGTASLDVEVLGDWQLISSFGAQACLNGSSYVYTISDFSGATFTWSISPATVAFTDFGSAISIDWTTAPGPGLYSVTASPLSPGPGDYCTGSQTTTILVKDFDPPLAIAGPSLYCPTEDAVYTIVSPQPGLNYFWSVSGGALVSGNGSATVVVNWTSLSSGSLQVFAAESASPFCTSPPAIFSATARTLLPITALSSTTACINQVQTYTLTPLQDAATTFTWTISPATAGSVIAGQGSEAVSIQWNNSSGAASLTVVAELCGSMETFTQLIALNVPTQPVISQSNGLCQGVSATLSIDPSLFSSAVWSPGGPGFSINISSPGAYVVNTIDLNGCTAVASTTAQQQPSPSVQLARQGPQTYCLPDAAGTTVNLLAFNNPNYSFQWYCNGLLQTETSATFTHTVTNTGDATFAYYYVVTDVTTGCQATSPTKLVVHSNCDGGPGCQSSVDFAAAATNQFPNCNLVDLSATVSSPVTSIEWRWPLGTPLSIVSGSNPNMTVSFSEADCYDLVARHYFMDAAGNSCFRDTIINVCIPLAADFSYSDSCGVLSFQNTSTVLGATSFSSSWSFGDSGTSTAFSPTHTYSGAGPFTVTLIVTDTQGCTASISQSITIGGLMNPSIQVAPAPYCVGDAIVFQGLATAAIHYFWDFGDGSQYVGPMPSHSYLSAGTYTVSLSSTNAAGCVETTSTTVVVSPNPQAVTIGASPSLIACEGETVTLCVPLEAGIIYNWNTSGAGNCISVTTSGIYQATLTTADGCSFVTDSVEVRFLPGPPAFINGSPILCDGNATTLTGPAGAYTYSWLNNANAVVGSSVSILLGAAAIAGNPYTLVVTDQNGCQSTSAPIALSLASSPTPVIVLSIGSGCEGEPNTLSVSAASFDPSLLYSWSNGQTGPTTIAAAAGTYTLLAVDPATGCSATATYAIYPLPDVCMVPVGCYETCRPDTLCGPEGDALTYQWYLDGNPITTNRCYIATLSGVYHLEVTNSFGCTATTDSLILEMIDCDEEGDCDDIITRIASLAEGHCCWSLNYLNLPPNVYGIQINSPNASLQVDAASIAAAYVGYLIDATTYQLGSLPVGQPLPTNSAGSVLDFCLADLSALPQLIIIDYLDADYRVFCSDTLYTNCVPEPPCIYVSQDTITCTPDKTYELTFTVCRPLSADFEVAYIELLPHSSAAATDLPQGFTISPALTATNPCTTITVVLTSMADPGEDFCYTVVAHSENPNTNPAALCCESEETYCLELPDCEPCDDLGVLEVIGVGDDGDCCFVVQLFNNVNTPILDGIVLCPLDPNSQLTAYTSLGGPWLAQAAAGNSLALQASSGALPNGNFELPRICQTGNSNPYFDIEIKWMSGDSVVCRDTITYRCRPDCGYLEQSSLDCIDGQYVWQGTIVNTSGFPMGEAHIVFEPSSGLSAYNTHYSFPIPIPPGGAAPISIQIGLPAGPGDTICVQVYLHQTNDTNNHLNCCDFKATLVMPDCPIAACVDQSQIDPSVSCLAIYDPVCGCDGLTYSNSCYAENYGGVTAYTAGPCPISCLCEEAFFAAVNLSFNVQTLTPATQLAFVANGVFGACDSIAWTAQRIGSTTRFALGYGPQLSYNFPVGGTYSVCMEVFRVDDNGVRCSRRRCRIIALNAMPVVFPNPSTGLITIVPSLIALDSAPSRLPNTPQPLARVSLLNLQGQAIAASRFTLSTHEDHTLHLDLSQLPKGVYFLRYEDGAQQWTEKIVLQ